MDVDFKIACEFCEETVWASEATELRKGEFEWTCANPYCEEHNHYDLREEEG